MPDLVPLERYELPYGLRLVVAKVDPGDVVGLPESVWA
jgi:hypothetical protein